MFGKNTLKHLPEKRPLAAIFSIAGPTLNRAEADFFRAANPLGFILFGRNIEDPAQLAHLVKTLKETVGWNCPILIDQEGGRVQRLKPPQWKQHLPPLKQVADKTTLVNSTWEIAHELRAVGINVDCSPVLDILQSDTSEVINDRALGHDADTVKKNGLRICKEFLKAGIMPVIKHIPGHGRATVDSHLDLPVVNTPLSELEKTDFVPFRFAAKSLVGSQIWGMMAHILYPEVDSERPSSLSPLIIDQIVRKSLGFKGFLLSDDLDMKALDRYGSIAERARLSVESGCDAALYCWADMTAMREMTQTLPVLTDESWKRFKKSWAVLKNK
ncbi:MAG: beta-N-acetylhexosaminidase [Alphaproteobacteria bacterium]|nr:beta-N-acetylhexosaminidase [Alphaproteobacteria bacterium]